MPHWAWVLTLFLLVVAFFGFVLLVGGGEPKGRDDSGGGDGIGGDWHSGHGHGGGHGGGDSH